MFCFFCFLFACLFVFVHGTLPDSMLSVVLVPVIKDSVRDSSTE